MVLREPSLHIYSCFKCLMPGAAFHSEGSLPEVSERLKSLVLAGAINLAASFNILADTKSGPLASEGSTVERRKSTSSTVQRRSAGKLRFLT